MNLFEPKLIDLTFQKIVVSQSLFPLLSILGLNSGKKNFILWVFFLISNLPPSQNYHTLGRMLRHHRKVMKCCHKMGKKLKISTIWNVSHHYVTYKSYFVSKQWWQLPSSQNLLQAEFNFFQFFCLPIFQLTSCCHIISSV